MIVSYTLSTLHCILSHIEPRLFYVPSENRKTGCLIFSGGIKKGTLAQSVWCKNKALCSKNKVLVHRKSMNAF